MTDDLRFERDLAAVVHEGLPDSAPESLRRRVGTAIHASATPRPSTRSPLLAAAFGLVAVLVVTAVAAPRFVPHGAAPSSSSSSTAGTPPVESQPAATEKARPEPIEHPGQVQVGELLTASDGWIHNTDGLLFMTHSGGETWRDITPPGLESDVFRVFFLDPMHGWVGDDLLDREPGQTLWRTVDSGVTWERLNAPGVNGPNWDLEFLSPAVGWLASDARGQQSKLRWTSDGGSTWSDPIDLAAATGVPTLQSLAFFDDQSGVMTANDTIFRTDDGGRSWIAQVATGTPDPSNRIATYGALEILDRDTAMVVGTRLDASGQEASRAIVETADAGRTWRVRYLDDLRRSWAFLDRLRWVATDGEQVWATADGGETFSVRPSAGLPMPLSGAAMHFVDADHAWASAIRGCPVESVGCTLQLFELYKTSDGGRTWALVGDCQPGRETAFVCPSAEPR